MTRRKDARAASWFSKRLTKALAKWTSAHVAESTQCSARLSNSCVKLARRVVSSGVVAKRGEESDSGTRVTAGGTVLHPQRQPVTTSESGNQLRTMAASTWIASLSIQV